MRFIAIYQEDGQLVMRNGEIGELPKSPRLLFIQEEVKADAEVIEMVMQQKIPPGMLHMMYQEMLSDDEYLALLKLRFAPIDDLDVVAEVDITDEEYQDYILREHVSLF